jgi:hypothetical protein
MTQPINPLYTENKANYWPALAGELPHGKDLEAFAKLYVQDIADHGPELISAHVANWSEFTTALAVAMCDELNRQTRNPSQPK